MQMENRSMRMLMQSITRKQFFLSFILFLILLIVCIIIGASGPTVTQEHTFSAWQCPPGVTYDPYVCPGVDLPGTPNTTWHGVITDLSLLNQNVLLTAIVHNRDPSTSVAQDVVLRVSVGVRLPNETSWHPAVSPEIHSRKVVCRQGSDTCDPIILAKEVYLSSPNYRFNVSMPEASSDYAFMGDISFILTVTNAAYTTFEVWFRLVFLLLTFGVTLVLSGKLRHVPWARWTLEQQWAVALLVGVMAYDNPFFPLSILRNGWFFPILDQVFTASFMAALLFFWIVMFDGLRKEGQPLTFVRFYLPKVVLVGLIWLCSVIVYSWFELHEIRDPVWSTDLKDNAGWVFFSIILAILAFVYLAYLVWCVASAWKQSRTLPHLGLRLKAIGFFTVLIVIAVVVGLGFSFVGARQNSSAQFLSYLGLFNLYIYYLAVMYFPSPNAQAMGNIEGHHPLEEEMDVHTKAKIDDMAKQQQLEDMDDINLA
eukprot:TRINITY_DN4071_c0_g1_i1.p1 TRINITY_DN4071_c0_g1~~TRINITY_DN4071_c0_g1_i1.p1  ORF type:complete len:482 (+),score=143.15 TRINITY_DN4071_c0_g1_i1:98-1543(+)